MIKYLILLFIVFGCNSPLDPLNDSECGIEIYCDLPYQNNVYSLEFNRDQIQTFTMIKMNTYCGLHNHIQWDTDYQYGIENEWVSLINPSSMTDEDGVGRVIFGTWIDFIGYTITIYGGYTDDLGNHFVDSIKVKII